MSFGQQWLNDWEDSRDENANRPTPVAHFKVAPKSVQPSYEKFRTILITELATVLSAAWAATIADRIAARLVATETSNTPR